jgi:NADPH2:quinone reductase
MKAIQIKQTGGPEVMELVDLPVPQPKPNEAVVKIQAAGVNFIDVYNREGRYKAPLPLVLGQEAAGVVSAVGAEAQGIAVGDRVAYTSVPGSYAEYAAVPGDRLVKIPDGVSEHEAAAAMLQGMTAHYLAYDTHPLKKGEIILYTQSDFEAETKRLTGGKGVDVIYDSVGKTTFDKGLNLLRPRGTMVLFGGSSGPVAPFDPLVLTQKGSIFLTRPSLGHYIITSQELQQRAGAVFGMIREGKLKLRIEYLYPLADAQQAHRDLEGRKTTGKLILRTN